MAKTRPKWVSWLPATLLAVLTVAALVVGYILVRGGLGSPAPAPTEGQVTDLNWSSFTDDGLDYIERTRDVRIDLSDKGADAVGLGLDSNGSVTIGPNPEGLFYEFIFKGGDVGPGGDKLFVNQLTVTTTDGEISVITADITDVVNFRDTINRLIEDSALYGWTTDLDPIYDMVAEATAEGESYEFTFGPGTAVGTPVEATSQCDPSGYCLLTYEIGPGVSEGP